jgi:hypothetical protein
VDVPRGLWKWVGLAGVAGVTATGAVVARDQRRRQRLTPDQVRTRLHRRLAELDGRGPDGAEGAAGAGADTDGLPHVPVKKRRH